MGLLARAQSSIATIAKKFWYRTYEEHDEYHELGLTVREAQERMQELKDQMSFAQDLVSSYERERYHWKLKKAEREIERIKRHAPRYFAAKYDIWARSQLYLHGPYLTQELRQLEDIMREISTDLADIYKRASEASQKRSPYPRGVRTAEKLYYEMGSGFLVPSGVEHEALLEDVNEVSRDTVKSINNAELENPKL